ncbi:hypothetical protein C4553_01890 [Candidatus Parcubacteria bacterium]|nr:MAG: hypothetical protein C4553_01890 [Candidatus Parcubacteria bacterium]
MRQSELFSKVSREEPKDEISVNARLLERGGFIRKFMAGVYVFLPLGWRVMDKINSIIKEEMNATGATELHLSVLQPKELWDMTGRWKGLNEIMYQLKDHSQRMVGLAPTHEEAVAWLGKNFIQSYRDLPKAIYQIQVKFRDELRVKSGLVRTREFIMKDLYSFHADASDLDRYYKRVGEAYLSIFKRCGLKPLMIEASGGAFTKDYSHEFQVLSPYGEDTIVYCPKHGWAQNKEIAKLKAGDKCPLGSDQVTEAKGVEVGNIFRLGTRFSKDLGLTYKDKFGQNNLVWMASYGIGPARVMGTIVDVHHDERGITWPDSVAPFGFHLIALAGGNSKEGSKIKKASEQLYKKLSELGIDVLYDDRDGFSTGEKLAEADLIGIPLRIVIGPKTIAKGSSFVEVKGRKEAKPKLINVNSLIKNLTKLKNKRPVKNA